MTSSWPPKRTFWAFWANFCRFPPIWPLWHRNYSGKLQWRLFNIPGRLFQKNFSKNFPPYWPYDVILTPKNALFEHFEQIFADFRLYDHYNIEIILENYGGDCSQYPGDYFKKFFQKFSTILALWRHLDPQKRTFWAFLANFCRFSPVWVL